MNENSTEKNTNDVNPILQALLIADSVYVDKNTGKHIIVGVFREIGVHKPEVTEHKDGSKTQTVTLPMSGSPFAYISMTSLRGSKKFSLRFVCLNDNSVIFNTDFNIDCNDPLQVIEFSAPLPPLHAKGYGVHVLELLCDDTLLGEFRINVTQMTKE